MLASEIAHEALVTPRDAFVPLADLRVIQRPGWQQLVTPSFRQGGFNEVSFSALADAEADAVIDRTIAEYRTLGIRFRWLVPPGSAPADLGARLAARGLIPHTVQAMAKSIDDADADDATHEPAITVEETDASTLDVHTRAMAAGWNVDRGPLDVAHAATFAMADRRHRLFLARVDGEPAATASYVAFPRSAYLLGAVTLPAFRKRGIYQALVAARLADARRRGIALATSHADASTSAPILERLGFRTVATFASYAG